MDAAAIEAYGQKRPSRMIDETPTSSISLGLGSVIIKRIISTLAGSIEISNHPEGGALIVLSIPYSDDLVETVKTM